MNVIKNLWSLLEVEVNEKKISNREDLKDSLQDAWPKICPEWQLTWSIRRHTVYKLSMQTACIRISFPDMQWRFHCPMAFLSSPTHILFWATVQNVKNPRNFSKIKKFQKIQDLFCELQSFNFPACILRPKTPPKILQISFKISKWR